MEIFKNIPDIFIQFIVVLFFSLLIGLEQRQVRSDKEKQPPIFGTDRTYAFIGVFGFILYVLDDKNFVLFLTGGVILSFLLGIFYYNKIREYKAYGMTSILVALLTYCLAPILITQPNWLSVLILVSILILVEVKGFFGEFLEKFDNTEFLTLARFLIIAGVVLPLLPTVPIFDFIDLSPHKIWLTIVVVSSISYLGYLLQKFVFHKSGILITGLLGGFYSSTATTFILSRRSKGANSGFNTYAASIVLATSMMYLRIIILMFIFNFELGMMLLPYFAVLILFSTAVGLTVYYLKKNHSTNEVDGTLSKNPLELKIALLFAVLFVLFSFITYYTIQFYGKTGLNILSYLIGFTDIDPYLLNLFEGNYSIGLKVIGIASFQAIISNNVLKAIYTLVLADRKTKIYVLIGLALITLVNVLIMFIM
ncbi:MgtC/SapB family protein [Bacteroidota bacterium]